MQYPGIALVCSIPLFVSAFSNSYSQDPSQSEQNTAAEVLRTRFKFEARQTDGNWIIHVPDEGIDQVHLRDAAPFIAQLRGTTDLDLTRSKITSLAPLKAITGLQTLDLSYVTNATLSEFATPLSLERLHINYWKDLENLNGLEEIAGLRILTLSGCRRLTNLDALLRLRAIVSLDISGCSELAKLDGLNELRALQELNLAQCEQLRDIHSLSNARALRSLNLAGCLGLADISSLEGLQALVTLDLSFCGEISAIDSIKGLVTLQDLDLGSLPHQAQNPTVLKNLRALRRLKLAYWATLENLNMLQDLRALRILNLTRADKLRDINGLKNLNCLTNLSLLGCKSLKNISVLRGLSSLRELDLRGCSGVPPEMIADIKRSLPYCTIEMN